MMHDELITYCKIRTVWSCSLHTNTVYCAITTTVQQDCVCVHPTTPSHPLLQAGRGAEERGVFEYTVPAQWAHILRRPNLESDKLGFCKIGFLEDPIPVRTWELQTTLTWILTWKLPAFQKASSLVSLVSVYQALQRGVEEEGGGGGTTKGGGGDAGGKGAWPHGYLYI